MKNLIRRLAAAVCALSLCLTAASALSVEQALELLEQRYVDPLPAAAYEATSLDGLFAAVGDPYTYYMTPDESEAFFAQVESESSVTGIGAAIQYTADGILITSVLPDGGAMDAGLVPGDLIVAIDGVSCVPAGDAHRAMIVGEAGTFVTLTVRGADGTQRDHRIERKLVAIHNTNVTLSGDAALIDCDSFGSQTEEYFFDGVARYGAQVSHWIVDLRGNPGGIADAAVGALGAFTGAGPKLTYRPASGDPFSTYYLRDAATIKPVIVLVDGNSASASEIFSGGIRAQRAGIVIGSRTYGKGTAQIVLDEEDRPDLFDGDCLKLTAYRFYCSDGNTTDRIGVLPTLLVPAALSAEVASLLSVRAAEGEALRLELNGQTFYLAPDALRDAENADAVAALFAALAPDVAVRCPIDGHEIALSPADAAAYYGVAYERRGFDDAATSLYADQINTLAVYGMLSGDGTGRFHPGHALTRAELATMLANALNVEATRSAGFSDVAEGTWYAPSVDAMAHLGFMQGVGDGRFDPDGTLTQEQLITVLGRLARFLNLNADAYAREPGVEDEASLARFQSWARSGAAVLTGYDGNMLYAALSDIAPSAPATREQAAATLCNLLKTLHVLSY